MIKEIMRITDNVFDRYKHCVIQEYIMKKIKEEITLELKRRNISNISVDILRRDGNPCFLDIDYIPRDRNAESICAALKKENKYGFDSVPIKRRI